MKISKLGELIAKAFALYYFIKTVGVFFKQLVPLLFAKESFDHYLMIWPLTSIVCFGVFSVLLWFYADFIGRKMAGQTDGKIEITLDFESALQLVFIGFGLYLLTPIIAEISEIFMFRITEGTKNAVVNRDWVYRALNVMPQTFIALVFIFKAQGLKNMLLRLRHAGVDK